MEWSNGEMWLEYTCTPLPNKLLTNLTNIPSKTIDSNISGKVKRSKGQLDYGSHELGNMESFSLLSAYLP